MPPSARQKEKHRLKKKKMRTEKRQTERVRVNESAELTDQSSKGVDMNMPRRSPEPEQPHTSRETAKEDTATPMSVPQIIMSDASTATLPIKSNHSAPLTSSLPAPANISVREYIYFLPHPLPPSTPSPYTLSLPIRNPLKLPEITFEPTSTLVLTSPNRTFVDLRFYKAFNQIDNETYRRITGPRGKLEWGFAGTSTSTPLAQHPQAIESDTSSTTDTSTDTDTNTDTTTTTNTSIWTASFAANTGEEYSVISAASWTHWIDSRYSPGSLSIPSDSGTMFVLPSSLTLECGAAYIPALDQVAGYEEMWRDEDIRCSIGTFVPAQGGKKEEDMKVCIVLRCDDPVIGARGVVIRVGQYVQGIFQVGNADNTTVERWAWCPDSKVDIFVEESGEREDDEGEGWCRVARVGDAWLPCAVCWGREGLEVGDSVKYGKFEWRVEEVWAWM